MPTAHRAFYEAEEKLADLRNPASYPAVEASDRPKNGDETEIEEMFRDAQYVPLARFDKQSEFWLAFSAQKWRARAALGNSTAEAFDEVEQAIRKFRNASAIRYRTALRGGDINSDLQQKYDAIVWADYDTPDELALLMTSAIQKMEAICVPKIRQNEVHDLLRIVKWGQRRLERSTLSEPL